MGGPTGDKWVHVGWSIDGKTTNADAGEIPKSEEIVGEDIKGDTVEDATHTKQSVVDISVMMGRIIMGWWYGE